MKLKAVYFHGRSETGLPYRKALVYESDVPFFEEMGAGLQQPTDEDLRQEAEPEPEPIEEQEPDLEIDPSKGYGPPGSLRWHFLHINEITDKNEVVDYATTVIKKDAGDLIDRRRNLARIKRDARNLIREHLRNDNQGK